MIDLQEVEKRLLFTDGDEQMECVIRGMAAVPFWAHDLKLKIALSLIQSVDIKDFEEQEPLFHDLLDKIHGVLTGFHGYYCAGESDEFRA